ncbi:MULTISPECIES: hypothetical protein [unclassified Imperialibacter]|uniref:hypothetical protein n=1 Tax=unclassified Imperialibacter TaxID=2629706 RepID=UPI00125401FD|nr:MULTISPECIES: hypothetical protein [unclassified Imperialibacter]CAD5284918.1 conserved exported hypothetical protein [Imperialibacter sp. 89]CAD5285421.1 conserved exported hypothetical protein [Imperialibacter sp. 75]VVT27940.1 conserved exported hypothetical protein [Imperialibacter sp. EC-SDR9]
MKSIFITLIFFNLSLAVQAQIDSTLLRRSTVDTTMAKGMNMDAVYNRPFLQMGKMPVSLGGYVEADYQYMGEDGVTDGHTFRIPRMTLFVASTIHRKIKFLSELELEEGGKEISIEFAAMDFSFHPLVNLRGGVVMNPIGAFNQNHDGPKWEFADRPIAMTQMLPATWSNVGFGIYGKQYVNDWAFGYETYVTNGFDDSIISNTENKTFLPASKASKKRFDESSNGQPLVTGKFAIRHNMVGEIGLSYMGGIFNKFQEDGLILDDKRLLDVLAVDVNTTLPFSKTFIVGEWAWVMIDVPETYSQTYGNKQRGGFIDVVQPVLSQPMLGFSNAVLNIACRLEYVDWNTGKFQETGGNISEHLWAIVPALSFRPTAQTVIRANYRYMQQTDLLGNPPTLISGIQLGVSSYF